MSSKRHSDISSSCTRIKNLERKKKIAKWKEDDALVLSKRSTTTRDIQMFTDDMRTKLSDDCLQNLPDSLDDFLSSNYKTPAFMEFHDTLSPCSVCGEHFGQEVARGSISFPEMKNNSESVCLSEALHKKRERTRLENVFTTVVKTYTNEYY